MNNTRALANYIYPICLGVNGVENDQTLLRLHDIVYIDEFVTAFINSFWITGSVGHVIVVPNEHYENIYDIPDELAAHIHKIARKVALAMKEAYGCDGVTTLQNNEPAGGQHAFHYHFHIFPRYEHDALHANMENKQFADPAARLAFAAKLKPLLTK